MKTRWLMLNAHCPWLAMATSCGDDDARADASGASTLDSEDAADTGVSEADPEAQDPARLDEQLACAADEDLLPGLPPAPSTSEHCPDVDLDTVTLADYAHVSGSFVVGRILDIRPDTGPAYLPGATPTGVVPREECDAVAPRLVMDLEVLRHLGGYPALDHFDVMEFTLGDHENLPTETGWHSLDDGGWCWTEGTGTAPVRDMIIGGPIWHQRVPAPQRHSFAVTPFNRIFAVDEDGRVTVQQSAPEGGATCAALQTLWDDIEGMNVDDLFDALASARSNEADLVRVDAARTLLGVQGPEDVQWGLSILFQRCDGHVAPTEPTPCPRVECEWPHQRSVDLANGCRGCEDLAPTGAPCDEDPDCHAQHFCDNGTCALGTALTCDTGEECPARFDCIEGWCSVLCGPGRECMGEARCGHATDPELPFKIMMTPLCLAPEVCDLDAYYCDYAD